MKVFKRTPFQFVKSLAIAVFGSAAVTVVLLIFLSKYPYIPILVGLAVLTALLYMAFVSEDMRVEIGGGELVYFVKGREKERIALRGCEARYHIRKSDGSTDFANVFLRPVGREDEICIDCAPLGRQFQALWALLERECATAGPEKTETKRAGE